MGEAYVFWCSRCKKEHPGECSTPRYASALGPTSDPGPGPYGPHAPVVGTRWDAIHEVNGSWVDGFYGIEVKQVVGNKVICEIPGIGPGYVYPLGCWSGAGEVWNEPGLWRSGSRTKMRLRS